VDRDGGDPHQCGGRSVGGGGVFHRGGGGISGGAFNPAVGTALPVIAGTGANSTSEAVELTRYAREVGAAAGLSVVPYYNKPTQEGLYRHFRTIAESVDLPVMLYNVPSRTIADLSVDTTLRLAQVPGVIGLKDATGDLFRTSDLARRAPQGFCVLSGDDATAMAAMFCGMHGVISVTTNVAPRAMRGLCDAARAGRVADARAIGKEAAVLQGDRKTSAPICVKRGFTEVCSVDLYVWNGA
jgi:4-hydroxy-tetrahydrodipicolinate synthase